MKTFIFFICLLTCNTAFAQTFMGIKAGANFTTVASPDLDSYLHTGFSGGLTFEQMVTSRLSISGELLFSQRGHMYHIQYSNSTFTSPTTLESTSVFNYLCVPIKASLWFGHKSNFFGSFGLVPGFLINGRGSIPAGGGFPGLSGDISDQAKKFDLAGMVEFGGTYPLNDQYSLVGTASFQYSFTSFSNISTFPDLTMHHYGITISAGIRRKIGGKDK